jgi:ubiquinone/menaquinone biosynthesis C-methylase UbiE
MASGGRASVNYWPQSACARAFWGQQEVPPYQRLLKHTTAWLDPQPGQRWLDLGCGGGRLTRAIWEKSAGQVAEVIGMDCASANETAFQSLRQALQPEPSPDQVRFVCADFSHGLAHWPVDSFDGVVSGLAIQYAEHYSETTRQWTTEAYDRLLGEVFRVLRPGAAFVFSVNIPKPSWGKVAWRSWKGFFKTPQPFRFLKRSWRMMRYGAWLVREAESGRFHYLPLERVKEKLRHAGFERIEHRMSFVGQAYLIRCRKPLAGSGTRSMCA